jgi:hypothetical protein
MLLAGRQGNSGLLRKPIQPLSESVTSALYLWSLRAEHKGVDTHILIIMMTNK